MSNIEIEPLSTRIGAIIHGIDLSEPVADAQVAHVHDALIAHKVVFLRDQRIDPVRQRNFAARFGALHIHPVYPKVAEAPEIIVLEHGPEVPPDNDTWHSDVTFIQTPPMGAILHARILPPRGGDTTWSDSEAVYEALSPAFQSFLGRLTAEHDLAQSFNAATVRTADADVRLARARAANPPVVHPVVRTHPVTGRKCIFVNASFTTRIVELSPAESRIVLSHIYALIPKPEFTVRWRWRRDDIAFWDNRNTQHYALADYFPEHRLMHRATILGDRPF